MVLALLQMGCTANDLTEDERAQILAGDELMTLEIDGFRFEEVRSRGGHYDPPASSTTSADREAETSFSASVAAQRTLEAIRTTAWQVTDVSCVAGERYTITSTTRIDELDPGGDRDRATSRVEIASSNTGAHIRFDIITPSLDSPEAPGDNQEARADGATCIDEPR